MFYFKFKDKDGMELYGKVNIDKAQLSVEKLKNLLQARTLEEITKAEYEENEDE